MDKVLYTKWKNNMAGSGARIPPAPKNTPLFGDVAILFFRSSAIESVQKIYDTFPKTTSGRISLSNFSTRLNLILKELKQGHNIEEYYKIITLSDQLQNVYYLFFLYYHCQHTVVFSTYQPRQILSRHHSIPSQNSATRPLSHLYPHQIITPKPVPNNKTSSG